METFTHRDLTVVYRDEGQGSPIVMLHNGGTSSTIWRHQVDALCGAHRVIAVDLPGFGSSPRPAVPAPLGDLVDLVAAIVEELDLGPTLLVGNCMGTNISVSLARTRPELVTGILAVNPLTDATFSAGRIGFLHKMGNVAAAPTRAMRSVTRKVRSPRAIGVASLRFQLGSRGVSRNLHHDPELLACQTRSEQLPALIDVLDDMAAYGEADRSEVPAHIPVWIVWGEQNRVLSRHRGQHLADRFHAERVEVLDGCGHLPMLEEPEAVNDLIRALVDRVEGGGSPYDTIAEEVRS